MLHCDKTTPLRQYRDIRWLPLAAPVMQRVALAVFLACGTLAVVMAMSAGLPRWSAAASIAALLGTLAVDWHRHGRGDSRQSVVAVGIPASIDGRLAAPGWALRLGDGREARVALETVYLAHALCVCARFTETDDCPDSMKPKYGARRVTFVFGDQLSAGDHRALRCAVRGAFA